MKRLAVALALAGLTSCAPIMSAVQNERGTLTIDQGTVLLKNYGPGSMNTPAVLVEGSDDLLLPSPCVRRTSKRWGCVITDVPVNKAYRLTPTQGTVSWASVSFYRAETSTRPLYLEAR